MLIITAINPLSTQILSEFTVNRLNFLSNTQVLLPAMLKSVALDQPYLPRPLLTYLSPQPHSLFAQERFRQSLLGFSLGHLVAQVKVENLSHQLMR
jgi:hypothetical protein